MPTLADVYSYLNTQKRRLNALIEDPLGTIDVGVRRFGEDWTNMLALQDAAMRGNPEAIQQLAEYAAQQGSGAFMPAGMIRMSHGSPHKFEKFDASKIGTGEGAQAYGHGLYTAEEFDSPVAKMYKEKLQGGPLGSKVSDTARRVLTTGDAPDWKAYDAATKSDFIDAVAPLAGKGEDLIRKATLDLAKRMEKSQWDIQREYAPKIRALSDNKELMRALNADVEGHLYNIEAKWPSAAREATDPLGPQHFLDWDKPLSEQSEIVRNALKKLPAFNELKKTARLRVPEGRDVNNWSGSFIHRSLQDQARHLNITPEEIATALSKQGIPGIRYLDAGSRAAGQGTHNYVIFPGNENLMNIVSRNNQPINALRK